MKGFGASWADVSSTLSENTARKPHRCMLTVLDCFEPGFAKPHPSKCGIAKLVAYLSQDLGRTTPIPQPGSSHQSVPLYHATCSHAHSLNLLFLKPSHHDAQT